MNQKLNMALDDSNHLRKCLDDEERGDKATRNLQVEVAQNRDNNKFLKQSISETDRKRTEAIQQLRQLQNERERSVGQSDELKLDFQRKLAFSKDLESDSAYTRE